MEKEQMRYQLLALLNQDNDWFKKPETELYQKIVTLGRQLWESDMPDVTKKYAWITKEKYRELENQGMLYREIANYFKVSEPVLRRWRVENGIKPRFSTAESLTIQELHRLRDAGATYREIAEQYKMSEIALQKWRKENEEENKR